MGKANCRCEKEQEDLGQYSSHVSKPDANTGPLPPLTCPCPVHL